MSVPAWLEWVKAPTVNEAELTQMDEQVSSLVKQVSACKDHPNWRSVASRKRGDAKKYRAAAKVLANLPEPFASSDLNRNMIHNMGALAMECESRVASLEMCELAPNRKGAVLDLDRIDTVYGCELILGYQASTATLARLALWVWNEAHNRQHDGRQSDVDAWETTTRRARAPHPNGRPNRHKSKPR